MQYKNNFNGYLLDNRTKSLKKIKAWYLLIAFSNNSGFTFIKMAI